MEGLLTKTLSLVTSTECEFQVKKMPQIPLALNERSIQQDLSQIS
jgi:hypothetical protein